MYRAPTGVTSSNRSHVEAWIKRHFKSFNPEELIAEIETDIFPLEEVLNDQEWPGEIDVLQIDTEGMDAQVLKFCNLAQTKTESNTLRNCPPREV
jgi:hypothetical protein